MKLKTMLSIFGSAILAIPPLLLWRIYVATPCLKSLAWDPACHALDGLRLYNDLTTFAPFSFWQSVSAMVWWPPLPPLMMVPFYFIFDKTFAPVALSLFCFWGTLLLAQFFFESESRRNARVPAVLGLIIYLSFTLGSALTLRYSIQVMYELPGAFLTTFGVVLYWKALRERNRPDGVTAYRRFALAALALVLMKWNYGLQLLVVVLATELAVSPRPYLGEVFQNIVHPQLDLRMRWFLSGWLIVLAVAIGVIAKTGGMKFTLAGIKVSATTLANPAWLFLALFAIRTALILRGRSDVRRTVAPIHRVLFTHLIFPYTAWLLYPVPNRFQILLGHLRGSAPSEPLHFSYYDLTFYLKYIAHDYLLFPAQAWFGLAGLAAAAYFAYRENDAGAKAGIGYVLFAWFSSSFLTNTRDARLILNFMPVGFLLAAWGASRFFSLGRITYPLALVALLFPFVGRERLYNLYASSDNYRQDCFKDEKYVASLKRSLVEPLDANRGFTTVGISDMSYVCPTLQLELNRAFPRYSHYPEPKLCDYGYRQSANDYVRRGVESGNLKWIAVFLRKDSPSMNSESAQANAYLEEKRAYVSKTPFFIEGVNYAGLLYRLR